MNDDEPHGPRSSLAPSENVLEVFPMSLRVLPLGFRLGFQRGHVTRRNVGIPEESTARLSRQRARAIAVWNRHRSYEHQSDQEVHRRSLPT